MKRLLRAAAWLILTALIALGPFLAASVRIGRENYIREHYASWTGVLRLWKCEGWQSGNGSLTGWLTACIEKFEKRHPGVYVQLTDVAQEAVRGFLHTGVNPPDMILYAPGMLDAPYDLMQMEEETPLRPPLSGIGLWQGNRYAVPVALGGYAMAINSDLLPETPDNWNEKKAEKGKCLLNAPTDGLFTSWSAALVSMFAGSYSHAGENSPAPVGDGTIWA